MKNVRHADNIFVPDDSRMIQSGTHEQLMQQGGLYYRFVQFQE